MNKKAIIIVLVVLVLAVIGAVIYFVMQSNKAAAVPVKTTNTSTSGVSGLLANLPTGSLTALLGMF